MLQPGGEGARERERECERERESERERERERVLQDADCVRGLGRERNGILPGGKPLSSVSFSVRASVEGFFFFRKEREKKT